MSAEDSEYRGERGVFLGATASATDEPRERREYTAPGRVILGLLHDKYLIDRQWPHLACCGRGASAPSSESWTRLPAVAALRPRQARALLYIPDASSGRPLGSADRGLVARNGALMLLAATLVPAVAAARPAHALDTVTGIAGAIAVVVLDLTLIQLRTTGFPGAGPSRRPKETHSHD